MGNRRIDRIFRHIATGAQVVVGADFFGQSPALALHLIGGLPCAQDDFAHAPHRLTV